MDRFLQFIAQWVDSPSAMSFLYPHWVNDTDNGIFPWLRPISWAPKKRISCFAAVHEQSITCPNIEVVSVRSISTPESIYNPFQSRFRQFFPSSNLKGPRNLQSYFRGKMMKNWFHSHRWHSKAFNWLYKFRVMYQKYCHFNPGRAPVYCGCCAALHAPHWFPRKI